MPLTVRKAIEIERSKHLGTEGLTVILYEETPGGVHPEVKAYDVSVVIPADGGSPEIRPERVLEYRAADLNDARRIYAEIIEITSRLDAIFKSFEEV